ncbi:hypothetical protein [Pseudomonas phage D6]|nr:hypothetical protein [Pseudomonas phage D6]
MELTPALFISLVALGVSVVALFCATRTERKVQVIPAPHSHEWETIKVAEISNIRHPLIGHLYTLRCKGCGTIKGKRVDLDGES